MKKAILKITLIVSAIVFITGTADYLSADEVHPPILPLQSVDE